MMERCLCIHGHFYQPPREDPWTGAVEQEMNAAPFHDWNERITAECYRPLADAQLYQHMSFDFGPTLLSWIATHAPEVHRAIVAADQASRAEFSGHGSAMAQGYNHIILPLASRRDKETQIDWGVRDFTHRFGRQPEGLWLPETAVDTETLEVVAQYGLRFVVLAPHQARRVRALSADTWVSVEGGTVDPSMAYHVALPSGNTCALFFYDGPIARSIAFEQVLRDGDHLFDRLCQAFHVERTWPQLVHIATDGETYGHHHKFGEMALAHVLKRIAADPQLRLTNYGEFLERHPPTHAVEIIENSAWSCPHGVERWRSNCGCRMNGSTDQSWRTPLRTTLDAVRDQCQPLYEADAAHYLLDPWQARNAAITLQLDPSPEARERFFAAHASRLLTDEERTRVLALCQLQRHLMAMYTSCGWFFDEPSDISTQLVIKHARRATELAADLFGEQLNPEVLRSVQNLIHLF